MTTPFLRLLVEELKAASDRSVATSNEAYDKQMGTLANGASSAALVSAVLADCIENALNKSENQEPK